MFDKLRELLSKRDLLAASLEQSWKMLAYDKDMFDAAIKSLRELDIPDMPLDIFQTDREINRLERDIRKNILTHLAISGTANLSTGLALVSIIIDIERIGDYTKNIYELALLIKKKMVIGSWEDDVRTMEQSISEGLAELIDTLQTSDRQKAKKIVKEMALVKKSCDNYVIALIKGENESLDKGDAVSLVLYLRYLKRVAGHLQNVATSVENPFHKIGYMKKKFKKESSHSGNGNENELEEVDS